MAVDTGDKVTRKYANFRGVDFRGEECSLNRSPDALNVWRNYKKLASIETRPGLEVFYNPTQGVRSMRWHKSNGVEKLYYIGRDDKKLHKWDKNTKVDTPLCTVNDNGFFFEFEGKLYVHISDIGTATNDNGLAMETCIYNASDEKFVAPFIPTTTIKKPPSGGGETYQDVNMLSPFRINTFRGDDKSNELRLDAQNLDKSYIPVVTIDGEVVRWGNPKIVTDTPGVVKLVNQDEVNGRKTFMEYGYVKGYIRLYNTDGEKLILPAPKTDGQDNISVQFKKENKEYVNKIKGCTIAQEFDNRVFFSGNPAYPNMVWHSSLSDPSYFSDLDCYEDGKDAAPIRSLVAGNNALWVFRDAEANNGVYYHVPTIDSDYGKVYPSSHSSISLGCAGRAINFNDDIVFFSRRGMESASTDITTEQFATHKSSLIDRKMITHPKYKDMIFAEWEGYLLVFMGNEVFLADSRAMLTNENHYEYEWYHWKLFRDDANVSVTCATVCDGVLYVGTERDIYAFKEDVTDVDVFKMCIDSYWTTPKDKFGAANKLKTTNKKGCVVEATGDVDIYAKVEDTGFELIGTNNGVDDYFVSRIKRKKFKDIQLKFQSQTGFCLESATLECFVGGYIKR